MEHKETKLDTVPEKCLIATKARDQESVDVVSSCLTRNILQAAEKKSIPKTYTGTKKRSPVA